MGPGHFAMVEVEGSNFGQISKGGFGCFVAVEGFQNPNSDSPAVVPEVHSYPCTLISLSNTVPT